MADSNPGEISKLPPENTTDIPPLEEKLNGTFSSLRIRNFRFLLTNQILSQAGNWIQQITVNWLAYKWTSSGTVLGSLSTIRSITALGMIPAAGYITDRYNRRNVMMVTAGWIFLVTLIFGLVILSGQSHLYFLFIFAFLVGLPYTIDQTLKQIVIFDLIPRRVTPNAMALMITGAGLMRSVGPALGGFLIIWFGPGGNFLVQAGAYALILLSIMQLQFPPQRPAAIRNSPLQNIKEGINYVLKEPVTRTFVLMGFILPLFTIPIVTILPPIYAVKVYGDDTGKILSFLMASVGVGTVFGGIFVASLSRVERRGLVQLAALFMLAASLILLAFSTTLWQGLLCLTASGFFEGIFITSNQLLLQLSIPDALRGRVTSVVNLSAALSPVGGLLAGIGSDLLGGPKAITMVMAGTAAGLAVFTLIFSSTIRNYRISQSLNAKTSPKT